MRSYQNCFILFLLMLLLYCSSQAASAQAQFQAPTSITLTVYRLNPANGAVIKDPVTQQSVPCTKNDSAIASSYGCTAITDNPTYAYPFDASTVTVALEGTTATNRYLRDVVAQEMSPSSFQQPALTAQAIAARTYAYWHIRTDSVQPGPIDNSNAYQLFLPYRYDQFSAAEQSAIDTAVQQRYYMSYRQGYTVNLYGQTVNLSDSDPIFAEFFADVPTQTVSSPTFAYLQGITDPISTYPDIRSFGHGRGLSQSGAGRWARGSSSYRCDPAPAACPGRAPSIPHTAWSVRWLNPLQILTHYYTGIHVRDANDGNRIVTPALRWNPLWVKWSGTGAHYVCNGGSTQITVELQNTGTQEWNQHLVRFDYDLEGVPGVPQGLAQAATNEILVPPGQSYTQTLTIPAAALGPVGTVKLLVFDMYLGTLGPFHRLESAANRPWVVLSEDLLVIACRTVYLPVIHQGIPVTTQ